MAPSGGNTASVVEKKARSEDKRASCGRVNLPMKLWLKQDPTTAQSQNFCFRNGHTDAISFCNAHRSPLSGVVAPSSGSATIVEKKTPDAKATVISADKKTAKTAAKAAVAAAAASADKKAGATTVISEKKPAAAGGAATTVVSEKKPAAAGGATTTTVVTDKKVSDPAGSAAAMNDTCSGLLDLSA